MLKNYQIPKKLKTVHFPGQQIELWINEKKIRRMEDVLPRERPFLRVFISNLENLGWKVLIQL